MDTSLIITPCAHCGGEMYDACIAHQQTYADYRAEFAIDCPACGQSNAVTVEYEPFFSLAKPPASDAN